VTVLVSVKLNGPLVVSLLVATGSHWFNGDATFALASKE
jgi:hypothetical protein